MLMGRDCGMFSICYSKFCHYGALASYFFQAVFCTHDHGGRAQNYICRVRVLFVTLD